MKRCVEDLANRRYDVVIVGGGIYGACIAWDAALRGLFVCLVERSDFGSATSANSLKTIHGGLRYIQHGNIKHMRELIRERQTWMRIAPHLIHPLPVLVPTYSRWAKEMLSAALLVNDLISLDRNRIKDPEKHIPRGRVLSKGECLKILPDIPRQGLTGGAVFYDAQVYNTERLLLAFLRSASKAGAALANYVEVTRLIKTGNRVLGVEVRDALTGARFDIRAKTIVSACGPWLDLVLDLANGSPTKATNGYAKAINLVTRSLFPKYAVGIPGVNGYRDRDALIHKRSPLLFVSPWHDHSLIGTRYAPYYGAPDDFRITESDVREFLDAINLSLPAANLKVEDVSLVHGGLLPTTTTSSNTAMVELAKRHKVVDHGLEGKAGLLSVRSTKYSNARLAAEKVVDKIFETSQRKPPKSLTSIMPLHGGEIETVESFLRSEIKKQPCQLSESKVRHLLYNYGSAYPEVLQYVDQERAYQPLNEDLAVLRAEALHGVRYEMAHKLSDVVFRRTDLGSTGYPGSEALGICASVMSAELGWSPAKTQAEFEETSRTFRIGSL